MLNNRYEFLMLFDVENGNPNGDPDMNNAPRIDFDSNHGYITDVCLKRKIRNYVELAKEGVERIREKDYKILIKPDRPINAVIQEATECIKIPKKSTEAEQDFLITKYVCEKYFDARAFGAVITKKGADSISIRGPVQINFARSISPIDIQTITITRQAKANQERQEKNGHSEFGRKSFVPYGLYRAEGYVSASLANKVTGLSEDDLELLWTAIINMFENDHSAARGKMCMRKLYVFKHENVLGNCPSHLLFDKITVEPLTDVPRSFTDYKITVDRNIPTGVELMEKL